MVKAGDVRSGLYQLHTFWQAVGYNEAGGAIAKILNAKVVPDQIAGGFIDIGALLDHDLILGRRKFQPAAFNDGDIAGVGPARLVTSSGLHTVDQCVAQVFSHLQPEGDLRPPAHGQMGESPVGAGAGQAGPEGGVDIKGSGREEVCYINGREYFVAIVFYSNCISGISFAKIRLTYDFPVLDYIDMGTVVMGCSLYTRLLSDGIFADVFLLLVHFAFYGLAIAGAAGEVGLGLDKVQARH